MKKLPTKIILSLVLSILVLVLSATLGTVKLSVLDLPKIISHKLFQSPLPQSISELEADILWKIRFPRSIASFLVGGALAVTGTIMQSVLRNPLASSYTLGVSSGASLGAALLMIFGIQLPLLGYFSLPVMGFLFGLLTVLVALTIATRLDHSLQNQTVILVGMVLSLFVSSILTLLISLYRTHVQRILFWQLGSFSGIQWREVGVLALVIFPVLLYLMRYTLEMDIMSFGEEHAESVGIELKKMKFLLISLAAFLTGTAVSFVGVIGFIDLISPHVVRKLFGSSHRYVLPLSFVFGGIVMALCDVVSRMLISPSELPIGAVTALIGAPFFTWVFFTKRGIHRA